MPELPEQIVIVGASLAGVRTAETLRRRGYAGKLAIVGAETHFPPHDRPAFSKGVLETGGDGEAPRVRIKQELAAELILGVEADGLDLADRTVSLSNGDVVGFDALAVATGAVPRRLHSSGGQLAGVFTLRTVEESMELRSALDAGPRVVIIGGGFIGAEVASSCRQRGLDVTVVESLPAPMMRALGAVVGARLAGLHRDHGTSVLTSSGVARLHGSHRVEAVELADGTLLSADVVVVGVGVDPQVGWLRESGVKLDDGVVLDETCTAIGTPNVTAAGDVARWFNPLFATSMRVEHWCNAVDQAEAAAASLLGGASDRTPFASVPYFWSDQYDHKIQFVGVPGSDSHVVEGSLAEDRFVVAYGENARVTGVLCVNSPARVGRYRRVVGTRARFPLDAGDIGAQTQEVAG